MIKDEWLRFKATCLHGQSRAAITSARRIFYAGAGAATNLLLHVKDEKEVAAVAREMQAFKDAAIKQAGEQGK